MPPTEGPDAKEQVVIVEAGSQRRVFAISALAANIGEPRGTVDTTVGDVRVRIRFTTEPPSAYLEPLADSVQAPVMRTAFWFAWHAQFPNDPLTTP